MLFLILSMLCSITAPTDVVEHLSQPLFTSLSVPVKITRVHLNPQEEEIYKEYIYKQDDKIRIDVDYGDSTITTFVYDGKNGYKKGRLLPKTGSLEMVLYGCTCGYLQRMEKTTTDLYGGSDVLLATGRQGNRLYLDYVNHLPIRYEFRNTIAEFKEYKKIDGFGEVPFLTVKGGKLNGVVEIVRITDIENLVAIPRNFFSIPKRKIKTLD